MPLSHPASALDDEPWLASFFSASTACLVILDPELRFLRVNETTAALTGRPAAAHVGRPLRELFPALADAVEALCHHVIGSRMPLLDVEVSGETPAQPGRLRHWNASYFPLSIGPGLPPGVGIVAVEITARKVAERALREQHDLLREAQAVGHLGSWDWDLRSDTLIWSDQLYRIFGCEPGATAPTLPRQLDAVHPDDRHLVRAALESHGADGDRTHACEFRFNRSDGIARCGLLRAHRAFDERGAPLRLHGIVQDITEYQRVQAELTQSQENLRQLAKRLDSVREEEARRIAREVHDALGQQLTAIKLELQFLEAAAPAASPAFAVQCAKIHGILDGTILAAQKISSELRLGHLEVVGLAEAIGWHAREFQRRTGIRCHTGGIEDIDNIDRAVATVAFRILQEALTNVARHAGATEVTLSLHLAADTLVLRVHDNGRGIAPRHSAHPGAIGLLGMRERAQALGGSVTIEPHPSSGTQVTAILPRCLPASP